MKRIVIIGGGFVAMGVARSLDAMSRFHVTLIDTKDYWEFTPAMIHAMVDPGFAEGFRVKHTEYIRNGRVIAATATDVNNSYVTADGVQYPYDYMVIATGSSYRSQLLKGRNMTTSYRVKRINQEFNSLQEAKDVLVVGGGVVGCELASELKGAFPDKNVTIVESNSTLLKRTPPRAQQLARRALEKMGVKMIFNERILQVSADDHQSYITNKGRKITCDKVYVATGPKPVSGFLKKGFPEIVNDSDFVSVLDTLQVVGHSNIFSGGDVCSIMHEKLAMSALQHGIAIARNICRLERGLPAAPLGTHGIYDTPKYPKYLYIMLGSAGGTHEFFFSVSFPLSNRVSLQLSSCTRVATASWRITSRATPSSVTTSSCPWRAASAPSTSSLVSPSRRGNSRPSSRRSQRRTRQRRQSRRVGTRRPTSAPPSLRWTSRPSHHELDGARH